MQSKSFLKILLLSINFEKYISINLWTVQPLKYCAGIADSIAGPSLSLSLLKIKAGAPARSGRLWQRWQIIGALQVKVAAVTSVMYSNRQKLLWSQYQEHDLLLPSMGFQAHGCRWFFRSMAVDVFSYARPSTFFSGARSHLYLIKI